MRLNTEEEVARVQDLILILVASMEKFCDIYNARVVKYSHFHAEAWKCIAELINRAGNLRYVYAHVSTHLPLHPEYQ